METVLKVRDSECVTWDYDEGADVLYISFGEPKPALALDLGEGVLVLYREEEGEMVGVTIIGAGEMLRQKQSSASPSRRQPSR